MRDIIRKAFIYEGHIFWFVWVYEQKLCTTNFYDDEESYTMHPSKVIYATIEISEKRALRKLRKWTNKNIQLMKLTK